MVKLPQPLTLHLGIEFLNAKVEQGALAGGTIDITGHNLPNAPRFSGTLSADWDVINWSAIGMTLHVDGSYSSKQYFELSNEDRNSESGRAT